MELEVNVIKLENNEDYVIVDAIESNGNKYLFLVNKVDEEDICVRKVIDIEGKEHLDRLTDEELEDALTIFNDKHKKKEGENEK